MFKEMYIKINKQKIFKLLNIQYNTIVEVREEDKEIKYIDVMKQDKKEEEKQ